MKTTARGFTLIELMTAILVLSVLVGIAVPSFREYTRETRATTAQNDLITALNSARSEALRRGGPVAVCASTNGNTCSGKGDWSDGWISFTDATGDAGKLDGTDVALQTWTGYSPDLQLTAKDDLAAIRYSAGGMLSGGAKVELTLYMTKCIGKQKRLITIEIPGFAGTTKTDCPS